MGFFDDIGRIGGGIVGGIAGLPAGIFGAYGGSRLGSKAGGYIQGTIAGQPSYAGDYSGMPTYPNYVGMEPDQFAISGNYGENAPLAKFSSESMRNGPSAISKFALRQNEAGATAGRDQARKLASGMAQDAQANLSMKGGLGAGASERINKYATNIGMDAANKVDANAGMNRANVLIGDEAARTGNLAEAAGLVGQNNKMGYDMKAGDLQRKQGEYDRRNLFNSNIYNQNMNAWAANKQANATANSGKK